MERLPDEELQAIKERAERATAGPWLAVPIVDSYEYVVVGDSKREAITGEVYKRDDAIFIEYARSDVTKLLAEVERLQAELEREKGLKSWYRHKAVKLADKVDTLEGDSDD